MAIQFQVSPQTSDRYTLIGASLSEPHHMGSTVKSVFLLACVLACLLVTSKYLYMAESRLSANQHYIKHYKHYIKHVEC